MVMRNFAFALMLLAFSIAPASADDLKKETFSPERFAALQAAGELVLVDIFATWCPVCAEQQKVLSAYVDAHPDVRLHVLEVDFDRHKDWVRQFRAPRQSTLILFRGKEQRWYSVAETKRETIFAALNEAAGRK
jgi:thiol-disulfide isomerase/thioredoxin